MLSSSRAIATWPDMFDDGENHLLRGDASSLQAKRNGVKRLEISCMIIVGADDYRYYRNASLNGAPPAWLERENTTWERNHVVRCWVPAWQRIICTGKDSYIERIMNRSFDGTYLDIIEAFQRLKKMGAGLLMTTGWRHKHSTNAVRQEEESSPSQPKA